MQQRLLLTLAFILTGFISLQAQPGTWAVRFGGASLDIPEDVVVDANGYAYVTGYFSDTADFGGIQLVSYGNTDAFLAKFDPQGSVVWARHYGTAGRPEYGRELDWAADGSLLVGGEFEDTLVINGDTIFNGWTLRNTEIFVLCIDTAGNYRWGVPVGHRGGDFIGGLEGDPNGNILVSGSWRVEFSILEFDETDTLIWSGGIDDIFLLRKDSTDNHHWITAGKSKQRDVATDMTVVGDTVIYMTGFVTDSAWFSDSSVLATTRGVKDIFVARYDTSGDLSWVITAGGIEDDFGHSITSDPSGNVYVAGTFDSSMTFMGSNFDAAGLLDAYVAKISPAGSLVWLKTFGGVQFDGIKHIRYNNGKLVITGFFQGDADFGGITLSSSDIYDQDLFVATLDNAGDVVWATSCGGVNLEQGNAVEPTADGHVYCAGSFLGTSHFGQTTFESYGSDDAVLLRFDATGRVGTDGPLPYMPFSLFPNPANDRLMADLTLNESADVSIIITDLQGREVSVLSAGDRLQAGNHLFETNISDLPSGMYLVTVSAGESRKACKLVIRH